jgi:pSer/pThr/pTyr-binding forkhead associated (FHA) protein
MATGRCTVQQQKRSRIALTFVTYNADHHADPITVTQDIIKIGTDPKSHLCVSDPRVSRMHAVVEVTSAEEISVIDLGNEPGTVVNGARVNKCRIVVGDQIKVGDCFLVLDRVEVVAPSIEARPAFDEPNPFLDALNSQDSPFASKATDPFAGAPNPFAFASPNPFDVATDPLGVAESGQELNQKYVLTKSGPDVNPEEFELEHVPSVEVMMMWGDTVLHVQHLTPPRSFYVGEENGKNLPCDYFIPQEKLGASRAPIVLVDPGGNVSMVILPNARGILDLPGQGKSRIEVARSQGRLRPCAELAGAHRIALPPGSKVRMELNGLVYQVGAVCAGRKPQVGLMAGADRSSSLYVALSTLAHMGIIAAMAFFVPPLGLTDDETMSKDQLFLLRQYLQASAERETEAKDSPQTAEDHPETREGGRGTRAIGAEGSMGNPNSRNTNGRYAVKGPKDNPNPTIGREQALRMAAEFGMIGVINSRPSGDPNAPTAPWGAVDPLGSDPISARGNMWGDTIDDAYGAGGLGLTGVGEGGNGRGEGIGLGAIGTIDHGAGTGIGQGFGPGGNSLGRTGGAHHPKAPIIHGQTSLVNGRLPPEVIQRIVRQNYGRFRSCYETGLRTNPSLQGRVAVRFIIGRDGAVSAVGNGGSDLPDPAVIQCVIRAYYGLSFPQPDGGIVTVVYPIMFSPGG